MTAYEKEKVNEAIKIATEKVIPSFDGFRDAAVAEAFSEYTAEEVTYLVKNPETTTYFTPMLEQLGDEVDGAGEATKGFTVDGYAYKTAIESFNSTYDVIGNRVKLGQAIAEIDEDTIIVRVDVTGENATAQAEIIFSNDMFMHVKSAALNQEASMGEMMGKAAMNTLIGMGTVFIVLLLISFIISCFSVIPKIQAKFAKKEEKKEEVKTAGIDNAVAQITSLEESVEEELTDDLELVAVIAAAIAASQGATSTDGFVVRSIRKARR